MVMWNNLPYEVQQLIVVEAVNSPDIFSPPSALLDILLLSREVHDTLLGAPERGTSSHNDIFIPLFESRFDSAAPKRRLAPLARGGIFTPDIFAVVFKQRCALLRDIRNGELMRRIRSNEISQDGLERVLWDVYLMLLEDDGKNRAQLETAGIVDWLRELVLLFAESDLGADGWPRETLVLQLAAASLAIVSDRANAVQEGRDLNARIIAALEAFFLGCHRYPQALLPLTWLSQRHISEIPVIPPDSLRTMATMPVSRPDTFVYFCHRLTLYPPPLATSASLIITNRQEQQPIGYLPSVPANRAEAEARGYGGATKVDWDERNLHRSLAIGVETPRAGSGRENLAALENPVFGSERWDHVFNRMRAVGYILTNPRQPRVPTWFQTMYQPGMFSGNWLGRIVFPDSRMIQRMHVLHPSPLSYVRDTLEDHELGVYVNFFQANFREHVSTQTPVGVLDSNSVKNGYFPLGVDPSRGQNMVETGLEVRVNDPHEPDSEYAVKHYKTYQEGMTLSSHPSLPPLELVDTNVQVPEDVEMDFTQSGVGRDVASIDVIITGETDDNHGKAWGEYTFYGRVRKLDGLILLVRPPKNQDPNSGLGRWIFYGYMHMMNTIVGNWRDTNADVNSAGLQAPFIISKVGPEFRASS